MLFLLLLRSSFSRFARSAMLLSPNEKNPEPPNPALLPNDSDADDGVLANGRNCDGDGDGENDDFDVVKLRLGWILLALEAATDFSDLLGDAVADMARLDLSYPILFC